MQCHSVVLACQTETFASSHDAMIIHDQNILPLHQLRKQDCHNYSRLFGTAPLVAQCRSTVRSASTARSCRLPPQVERELHRELEVFASIQPAKREYCVLLYLGFNILQFTVQDDVPPCCAWLQALLPKLGFARILRVVVGIV